MPLSIRVNPLHIFAFIHLVLTGVFGGVLLALGENMRSDFWAHYKLGYVAAWVGLVLYAIAGTSSCFRWGLRCPKRLAGFQALGALAMAGCVVALVLLTELGSNMKVGCNDGCFGRLRQPDLLRGRTGAIAIPLAFMSFFCCCTACWGWRLRNDKQHLQLPESSSSEWESESYCA
eukprot:TRINITY_DN103265_c0_g1_i1.p1 TRINITY_DN103265_c0_g1~~TRINITY_DN103265_c0_g1_i1.p1  ORF type:complete len:196 (-),score=26.88 TRINITY_DN103265_c0_g1_i1:49-573(-)